MDGERSVRGSSPRADDVLLELLARYIDRLSAGQALDPEEVRREHPEIAEELLEELRTFASLSPQGGDSAPTAFGDYEIVREIGRGGMGVVYEACDRAMDRRVALKVLPQDLPTDSRAIARFVKEARIAGSLQHPNVVSVHGMGIHRGAPYFVMELVHGTTLASMLREHAPSRRSRDGGDRSRAVTSLSPLFATGARERALEARAARSVPGPADVDLTYCIGIARTFAELADGLQHAHEHGVTHRDLKPSNVIVDREGRPRILDFGLARLEGQESLTRSRDIIGTPLYMSPEQIDASSVAPDQRSDIYGLGASLYEMLVFEPPFQGRNHQDTLSRVLHEEPRPPRQICPRIPRDLETIVLKCLEKDAGNRYRTAEALAQDLRRFVRGDPIEARPRSRLEKLGRRLWRRRGRLVALTAVLLLAATIALLVRSHREADLRLRESRYRARVVDAMLLLEYAAASSHERRSTTGAPAMSESPGTPHESLVSLASAPVPRVHPAAEALSVLEEATWLLPAASEAPFLRARALRLLGRDAEAEGTLERLATKEVPFVPAVIWQELRGESGEGRAGQPESTVATPGSDAAWAAAYASAYRAVQRRDGTAAVDEFSNLIRTVTRDGEPFIGALLEARLARGRARLELELHDEALEDFAAAEALAPAALEPPLLVATVYHLKGRPDVADARLRSLFEATPFKAVAARRIAVLEEEFHRYSEALAWAEHIPPGPEREQSRVGALVALGRTEEAVAAARKAVQLAPQSAIAHNTLGWLLGCLRRPDEALSCFRRVLEIQPDHAMAHNNIGWAHVVKGQLDEAMAAADRALEIAPRLEWPRIVRGACQLRRGEPEKAQKEYQRLVADRPRSALGHFHLGFIHEKLRRPVEAEAAYRRAIECNPRDLRSLYNLANLLSGRGKLDDAVTWYERALEVKPGDDWALNNLGLALFRLGRHEEAGSRFAAAVAAAPGSPHAYFNLAAVLEARGDLSGAIARLEAGIEFAPGDPRPLGQLARWREIEGELPAAVAARRRELDVYDELLAEKPDAETLVQGLLGALDDAARLFLTGGDVEGARAATSRALRLRRERAEGAGGSPGSFNDYAWALLVCEPPELQDPEAALVWGEKAVAASKGRDPAILDTLALASFRTGDLSRAVELEEQAIRLLPPRSSPRIDAMRKELETRLREFREARALRR